MQLIEPEEVDEVFGFNVSIHHSNSYSYSLDRRNILDIHELNRSYGFNNPASTEIAEYLDVPLFDIIYPPINVEFEDVEQGAFFPFVCYRISLLMTWNLKFGQVVFTACKVILNLSQLVSSNIPLARIRSKSSAQPTRQRHNVVCRKCRR